MINIYILYFHLNPTTNEIFYVGISSCNHRPTNFSDRNPIWHRYVKKHGKPIVKIIHTNLTKEKACALEKEYIKLYGRKSIESYGVLVNISEGGESGVKGMKQTKEHIEKRINSIKGRKHSPETKDKMREAKLGTIQSEEQKQKRSKSRQGKKYPKISEARKGLKQPPSFFEKKNKPIIQLDKNNNPLCEFPSITSAAKSLGYEKDSGGISCVLNGKQKTAYGFKWEYK
jgi:hypothetical protein